MYEEQLASFGYANVTVLGKNDRCIKAMADSYDGPKFLKIVFGEDEEDGLRHEVAFNECMRVQTHAMTPFAVPRSKYIERGEVRVAEFDRINAAWLHNSGGPNARKQPFNDLDIEQIYLAIRHIRSLPRDVLPTLLVSSFQPRREPSAHYVHHMHKSISQGEKCRPWQKVWERARKMIENVKDVPLYRCLTHGDLAPKNFGRLFGGRLVLVDAEFADWRFSWTDAVKMLMEMWTREGRPEAARRVFRYILNRHRAERTIDDEGEILFMFQYYVSDYLEISTREGPFDADWQSVLDVFERVLTGDIDAVVAD